VRAGAPRRRGPVAGLVARLVAGLVAAALALTGCSQASQPPGDAGAVERRADDPTETAAAEAAAAGRYVALGDSFTAAPLVPTTSFAGGCFRSDGNYPALVAERLDVDRLVDVSCSGATTLDLTGRQRSLTGAPHPPQLRALTRGTDLVTLGIGGNDFGLFATLVDGCTAARPARGAGCADRLDLVPVTKRVGARVEAVLAEVRRRAPAARVLLVGYPRLVPAQGGCPALPFSARDADYAARVGRALNEALASAARRAGVAFVDVYAASRDHDICAEEPWVNGARTRQGVALAFHPLAAGMEAVADEIVARLRR
jgi:lysophospholipase L1-like esterase